MHWSYATFSIPSILFKVVCVLRCDVICQFVHVFVHPFMSTSWIFSSPPLGFHMLNLQCTATTSCDCGIFFFHFRASAYFLIGVFILKLFLLFRLIFRIIFLFLQVELLEEACLLALWRKLKTPKRCILFKEIYLWHCSILQVLWWHLCKVKHLMVLHQ